MLRFEFLITSGIKTLAPGHLQTRFLHINVDNAPFLVTKLKIQVLPCVVIFIDGIGVDRVVGFEGLGFGDEFKTVDLERRLSTAGVVLESKALKVEKAEEREGKDDEDDWD